MPLNEKVHHIISKPGFFQGNSSHKRTLTDEYIQAVTNIITKSKTLLSEVNDQNVSSRLYDIIQRTEQLSRLLTQIEGEPSNEQSITLLAHCQELQREALMLPVNLPNEAKPGAINYTIAAACFYLLIISISLTMGACFGAWYFGFLTATYFTDTLVGALSAVGIPALCLGAISYGLHKTQAAAYSDTTTLEDDVANLCQLVVNQHSLEFAPASTLNPSNE